MNIKDRIRNNIVSPVVDYGGNAFQCLAVVLKTNEKNSTCKIKYRDNRGKIRTKRNVPVQLNSGGLIDWFPEKDDYVTINLVAGDPTIIGEPRFATATKNAGNAIIESDIYSDNMSGNTEGGYIF